MARRLGTTYASKFLTSAGIDTDAQIIPAACHLDISYVSSLTSADTDIFTHQLFMLCTPRSFSPPLTMDEELTEALDKVLSLSGGDPTLGKFLVDT